MLPPRNSISQKRTLWALLRRFRVWCMYKNAISRVCQKQEGFLSHLFMVPKRDGGQRPIINLKKLNFFVQTEHFKMEGNSHAQRSPKARQLDDKSRPERCLLHDTSSNKNHRKLTSWFYQRQSLFQGKNSWACISPREHGLHHQLPKIHSQTIKDDRIPSGNSRIGTTLKPALSRLLGKLNHVTQTIPPAPLFYCNVQSCLQAALEAGPIRTVRHRSD